MNINIAVFCHKRLDTLIRTVSSLAENKLAENSNLTFYSDAGRNIVESNQVHEVREYLRSIKFFNSVKVVERESNYGLKKNILSGMTEMLSIHGSAIFLEDDVVTSTWFIQYMSDALNHFKDDGRICCIAGLSPLNSIFTSNYALRGSECMAIATWDRCWVDFNPDATVLLNDARRFQSAVTFDNSYDFVALLERAAKGDSNQWAVLWRVFNFMKGRYTVYPYLNLVKHIGDDTRGEHYRRPLFRKDPLDIPLSKIKISNFNNLLLDDQAVLLEYKKYLKKYDRSFFDKAYWRLKSYVSS